MPCVYNEAKNGFALASKKSFIASTFRMIDIQLSDLIVPAPRILELDDQSPEFVAKYLQIKQFGVWEPLIVRPSQGGKFEVVVGFDRYVCSKLLGFTSIPCVKRDCSDVEVRVLQFQEAFMHRADRKVLAKSLRLLIHELPEHYTLPDIAKLVGQRTGTLLKALKPGFMSDMLKQAVEKGEISVGKATVLRRLRRKKQEDWLPRAKKMTEQSLRTILQKEHLAHVKRPKTSELMKIGIHAKLECRDLRQIKMALIDPYSLQAFMSHRVTSGNVAVIRAVLRWAMSVDPETQKRRIDKAMRNSVS